MKKIIATVLAMVMALALCTTAFAAVQTYDFYDAKTGVVTASVGVPLQYVAAKNDTVGGTLKAVAHYVDANSPDGVKWIATTADDADFIVKYHDTDNIAMYFKTVDPSYNYDGTAYTNIGEKCGQFKLDSNVYASDTKFYTATVDKAGTVKLFSGVTTSGTKLLVDGKLVPVQEIGVLSAVVEQHTWIVDRANMTAKCSKCGATAKLYKTVAECGTNDYEQIAVGLYAVVDSKAANTTTGTSSPKTFDAGIAMYVGMALTSVAGSAVVIGKKKEF